MTYRLIEHDKLTDFASDATTKEFEDWNDARGAFVDRLAENDPLLLMLIDTRREGDARVRAIYKADVE